MTNKDIDVMELPSIVFKVKGSYFCINSKYVSTILQLPAYEELPDAPPVITGLFSWQNKTVTMFDLRVALKMPSLMQEYQEFTKMLDKRKQDHIHWVQELERSIRAEEAFTLATDPHSCKLGKWYDNFESENNEINFHLKKMEEPHKRLHQSALEAVKCKKNCESCERSECLKKTLERSREEYVPRILELLEDAKEIFRSSVYHEMVFVLEEGSGVGVVVDEVISVESLVPVGDEEAFRGMQFSPYIRSVVRGERIPGLILELDVSKIIKTVNTYSEEKKD